LKEFKHEICLTTYEKKMSLFAYSMRGFGWNNFVFSSQLEEDLEVGEERALSKTTNSVLANQR